MYCLIKWRGGEKKFLINVDGRFVYRVMMPWTGPAQTRNTANIAIRNIVYNITIAQYNNITIFQRL